jgi:hypothetical protein
VRASRCSWISSSLALLAVLVSAPASASEATTPDRVVVRFIAPETGGAARPRFITERELAFFARIEALNEQVVVEGDAYPERYVRAATDRLVARAMLSSLMVQRGSEPPNLPRLALDARAELAERIGGASVLDDAMQREGIDEAELLYFLANQVRAAWYIDRAVSPILGVTDDSLREAYRSTIHPFRNAKFEDARIRLRRWLVTERMRAAELEFLQSARARIKIATVAPPSPTQIDERPR